MFGTNAALFHSFVPCVLEISQPDLTRRDATSLYVHFPGLMERSSTSLWLKHEISTAIRKCWGTLENGPYQVITQRHASSYRNRLLGVTRADAFRVGCPNIRRKPELGPFASCKTPDSLGAKLLVASTAGLQKQAPWHADALL